MELNADRKKLKQAHEELRNLPLPKFSKQDDLSNWIEELFEIDAHYAGLSLSVSEGDKISKENLYDLIKFRKSLDLIQHTNKNTDQEDLEIIKNCYIYLDKIQNIDCILKNLSK